MRGLEALLLLMMNVDIICTSYSVGDLTRSFLLFVVGQGPNVLLLARVKTLEGYRERERERCY